MGPSARWILVHNDVHINALDDTFGCASGLVDAFVADRAGLKTMNASCASHTPEVRVLANFPRALGQVVTAFATAGNGAVSAGLRLAAVGAAVVGDANWTWYYGDGGHGFGLRGGTERDQGDRRPELPELHAAFRHDRRGHVRRESPRGAAALAVMPPTA